MKIIKSHDKIDEETLRATIAIGNFDGIHLGHLKVIEFVKELAGQGPVGVLTFEPHPRSYFKKDEESFRLMNSATRIKTLEELNLDFMIELSFNKVLENLSPHQFAKQILSEKFKLKHIIIGNDFRFGKNRAGNIDDLTRYGKEFDFEVSTVKIRKLGTEEISSSTIRKFLKQGLPKKATEMLGKEYQITGKVEKGFQRGRDLGFPTINITFNDTLIPKYGVYAVIVMILSGDKRGMYYGAASIGERPTFGKNIPNLEVHLLDFSGDLYEEMVNISLVEYQREEVAYKDQVSLVTQMKKDCNLSRKILNDRLKENDGNKATQ